MAEARCGGAPFLVCTRGSPGISALLLNTGQLLLGRMWTVWRADHTQTRTQTHSSGEEKHDTSDGTVTTGGLHYSF